jgi:transposase
MHYKKKSNPDKCVCIPKGLVKNNNGTIHLSSHFFKENNTFRMGKKTLKKYKDVVIDNDSRIIKQKNIYYLIICLKHVPIEKTPEKTVLKQINYCGVDPGIRTFMTSFGNNGCTEYHHNNKLLKLLNTKISKLKELRTLKKRNRILKRKLNKIEIKKDNLINELHWKVITDLLNKNEVIFYGDIKSHDICFSIKIKVKKIAH